MGRDIAGTSVRPAAMWRGRARTRDDSGSVPKQKEGAVWERSNSSQQRQLWDSVPTLDNSDSEQPNGEPQ